MRYHAPPRPAVSSFCSLSSTLIGVAESERRGSRDRKWSSVLRSRSACPCVVRHARPPARLPCFLFPSAFQQATTSNHTTVRNALRASASSKRTFGINVDHESPFGNIPSSVRHVVNLAYVVYRMALTPSFRLLEFVAPPCMKDSAWSGAPCQRQGMVGGTNLLNEGVG